MSQKRLELLIFPYTCAMCIIKQAPACWQPVNQYLCVRVRVCLCTTMDLDNRKPVGLLSMICACIGQNEYYNYLAFFICMYVFMYVCMYVCMCLCMYVLHLCERATFFPKHTTYKHTYKTYCAQKYIEIHTVLCSDISILELFVKVDVFCEKCIKQRHPALASGWAQLCKQR